MHLYTLGERLATGTYLVKMYIAENIAPIFSQLRRPGLTITDVLTNYKQPRFPFPTNGGTPDPMDILMQKDPRHRDFKFARKPGTEMYTNPKAARLQARREF